MLRPRSIFARALVPVVPARKPWDACHQAHAKHLAAKLPKLPQYATIISSQVARSHDVANRKVFLNGPGQNLASWRFPIQLGHLRALLFATTGGSPGLIHADPVRLEVSAAEVDE